MPHSNTEPGGTAAVARQPASDVEWREPTSAGRRWMRRALLLSDALSAKPVTGLVFAASVVGFGALIAAQGAQGVEATAVAHAPETVVETLLLTTVAEVHVKAGAKVQKGEVLVTLDSAVVDRELETVEREIQALEAQLEFERIEGRVQTDRLALEIDKMEQSESRELELARSHRNSAAERVRSAKEWRANVARLVEQGVEPRSSLMEADLQLADAKTEQSLWATQVRNARGRNEAGPVSQFDADALGAARTRLTEARLELLKLRRHHLGRDLEKLVVRAPAAGRISMLATVGARTETLPALATITPERAQELVAYLPANLPAHRVPDVAGSARLSGCATPAQVVRVGGSVRQAPGQVQQLGLQGPVFGLPVYLSVPPDCAVVPGALAQVEILP